jgi:Carboxypeptidase regulatory-like domain
LAKFPEHTRIKAVKQCSRMRFFKIDTLKYNFNIAWTGLVVLSCVLAIPAHSQQVPQALPGPKDTTAIETQQDEILPATISGTVLDGAGAVVVGARITLTRAADSTKEDVVSGDTGQFLFANLAPGDFELKVSATGFNAQTTSVALRSGQVYFAPTVTLTLAKTATEIHVSASPIQIATAQLKAEEKQRILGVVPNFYVSYAPDAAPLASKQKMDLAWKSTFDPVTVALTAVTAGAEQAQNAFSDYGQGIAGYAKRFGAAYADNITSTFIGSAILPAILKQDPRYFYKGTGSTRSRLLYALANSVICKGDNGHWQPNYSAILGGFASGGISNLYYPDKDRGNALVFENTLIGTGETAIFNVFQEFFSRRVTPHIPDYRP